MSRLIDETILAQSIRDTANKYFEDKQYSAKDVTNILNDLADILDRIPATEIVRCGQCKYYDKSTHQCYISTKVLDIDCCSIGQVKTSKNHEDRYKKKYYNDI